jgi:hypothetical protein
MWVKRFIFSHNVRHPAEMADPEINAFLTHLALKERVSASTQNQGGKGVRSPVDALWSGKRWGVIRKPYNTPKQFEG